MCLSRSQGTSDGEIVLFWNKYEDESGDYSPQSYSVYRGFSKDNMLFEHTITGGLNTYSYNVSGVADNELFIVSVDFPSPCVLSDGTRTSGGPYYQSVSNVEDEGLIDTGSELINYKWGIYPNPLTDKGMVEANKNINSIHVFSVDGRLLKAYTDIHSRSFEIDRADLEKGSYIIVLNGISKSILLVQ